MATWEEASAHLRAHYKLLHEEPGGVALVWHFEVTQRHDLEVVQREVVERVEAFGEPHVRVWSEVGPADVAPLDEALAENMVLAAGALATHGGMLVVRQILPLASLPLDMLDAVLERVAHEAARLRMRWAVSHPGYVR